MENCYLSGRRGGQNAHDIHERGLRKLKGWWRYRAGTGWLHLATFQTLAMLSDSSDRLPTANVGLDISVARPYCRVSTVSHSFDSVRRGQSSVGSAVLLSTLTVHHNL